MSALVISTALLVLGHDDYPTREWGSRAASRLVRADPGRWGPYVACAVQTSPCPETRARAARMCGPYLAHQADTYTPSTVPVWPDIDHTIAAGLLDWDERSYWFARACPMPRDSVCGGPHWHQYRRATELWCRSMIRAGQWGPAEADAALARVWERELVYFADGRHEMRRTVATWLRWEGGYPR